MKKLGIYKSYPVPKSFPIRSTHLGAESPHFGAKLAHFGRRSTHLGHGSTHFSNL